jgi:hypothetical protein
MDLLDELSSSIKGLKLQSEIALASQGNNKEIDRAKLKEAQLMISPDILKSNIIKDYMKCRGIESLIEIDESDLFEWMQKEFSYDHSEVANLVSIDDDEKIHLGSSLQKIKEDTSRAYIETSRFTICDKKVKGYGASNLVVNVNLPNLMKTFFEESKYDFENVCEDCMDKAFGKYWRAMINEQN